MKTIKWILWSLWYLPQPMGNDLTKWLLRFKRTRSPWWKFKPFLWRIDEGKMWEVRFSDENSYVRTQNLRVDVHIGETSGKITGINVSDSMLERATQSN